MKQRSTWYVFVFSAPLLFALGFTEASTTDASAKHWRFADLSSAPSPYPSFERMLGQLLHDARNNHE